MNARSDYMKYAAKQHKAVVLSKTSLAPDIFEILVQLPQRRKKTFEFKPGQCAGFCVTKNYKRLYSFASAPNKKDELAFCVDVSPMGRASKFVKALKPGSKFKIEGPYGAFTVNDISRDLLFVATGVGIAPFKGIISHLLARGFKKKLTLLFGVRSQKNMFYHDYFAGLAKEHKNFQFIQVLSKPGGKWPAKQKGRVTDYMRKNYARFFARDIYICGSPQMIGDVYEVLQKKGHKAGNVFTEEFV